MGGTLSTKAPTCARSPQIAVSLAYGAGPGAAAEPPAKTKGASRPATGNGPNELRYMPTEAPTAVRTYV
jgi:hypothetical protein